jgi:hypothetical protein
LRYNKVNPITPYFGDTNPLLPAFDVSFNYVILPY